MQIIVGGATGLVGTEILEVLEELLPEVTGIVPAASERSSGQTVYFREKPFKVVSFKDAMYSGAEFAIFSAGSEVSKQWAPEYAKRGIKVIDNSSAWRNDPQIPLVVPEVNACHLTSGSNIIANPNCSTIQLIVALFPLHENFGLKRVVASTYQSVSGSGKAGIDQLEEERKSGAPSLKAYPYSIDMNALPHGGKFLDNRYTTEEQKLIDETRKILDEPDLPITSTVVRIPVTGGHSESINAELENSFTVKDVQTLLGQFSNIKIEDDPSRNLYPMPIGVRKSNHTHIGRIRRDESVENGLNFWVVADNLRKGAATNAVQILGEFIHSNP